MEHLDAALFQTLNTLPSFPFAHMVRPDVIGMRAMQRAYFAQRTLPTFTYRRAYQFNTSQYFRALDSTQNRIASLPAHAVVHTIYQEKIEELRLRCTLVHAMQEHDDDRVTSLADRVFGTSQLSIKMLEEEFVHMQTRTHHFHEHEHRVNAKAFAMMVQETLQHYGIAPWSIRETARSSISIVHGNREQKPIIKIPKTLSISRARAARLLTHEIEVHALRKHNGKTSPILLLGRGLANYIRTDEGLAMTVQQRLRPTTSTIPGFWDAWAAALTLEHGFMDAFDVLTKARMMMNVAMSKKDAHLEAQQSAWRLMLRVSRGIHHPGRTGLGYRRDHIYRSGYKDIQNIFNTYGETIILPTLFAGHAGIQHIDALKELGITGKTPDMISAHIVRNVLRSQ